MEAQPADTAAAEVEVRQVRSYRPCATSPSTPIPARAASSSSGRVVSRKRSKRSTGRSSPIHATPHITSIARACSSGGETPRRRSAVSRRPWRFEPRLGHAWLNRAAVEKALGRGPEARRSLADLLSLDPPPDSRILAQARSLDWALEQHGVEVAPAWRPVPPPRRRPTRPGRTPRGRGDGFQARPGPGPAAGHGLALQGRRPRPARPHG